jgi:hypothetical protein
MRKGMLHWIITAKSLGCVIAYMFARLIIMSVTRSFPEMATVTPLPGAFLDYPRNFVDEALGLAIEPRVSPDPKPSISPHPTGIFPGIQWESSQERRRGPAFDVSSFSVCAPSLNLNLL